MKLLRPLLVSLAIPCVLVSIASLSAQALSGSRSVLLAMGMNAKQVVGYQWKQRITVVRRGKPSEPIVDQVRFEGGEMQRTTISAPPQKEMGGIRGRVASGVKENVKDIMQLAASYNKPQQMMAAVKKSQISQSSGGMRLEATNLIQPTDSMVMLVDPATHLARHVDIQTTYQGGPMTIAQDYSPVPGGPNMMKTMRVSAPEKGLVVNVDSYDFARQTASR